MTRLTIKALHDDIGITPDIPGYGEVFGKRSKAALFAKLSNLKAPAITETEFKAAADRLGVPVGHIKGVRKVEAPRGPYDDDGRPSILYERHVAYRNLPKEVRKTIAARHPKLFYSAGYGPGGYGGYGMQYDKLAEACAIDPEAAFAGCSWGAFQVLGENAIALGYASAYDMAKTLTISEAAHLETFVRFVVHEGLTDEFRACRPGNPDSCIPFVSRYNGSGFRAFKYHTKLAAAI